MKNKFYMVCLILLIAALALPARATAVATQGTEARKVKCPSRAPVMVEAVQPAAFSEYVRIAGPVRPERVAVVSPIAGVVSEIRVGEGSLVDSGQVLAVLNAGMDEKVKALENEAARRKKILVARQNWKEKSEKAIQSAERDYQAALALLEEGRALAGRTVQAPLAGIAILKAESGAEVAAEALLFEIVDPLRLRGEAVLDEDAAALFTAGDVLTAEADGVDGTLEAEIVSVAAGRIAFRVNNSQRQLQEGMVVRCKKLQATHEQALAVPSQAVFTDSLGDFVYIAEKKIAKKSYVTVAASEAGRTLIEKGLAAGSQLIVSGFECLSDRKKVHIVNEAQMAGQQSQAEAKAQKAAAAAEAKARLDAEKQAKAQAELEAKQAKAAAAAELKAGKEQEKQAKATAEREAKQAKAEAAQAEKEEQRMARAAAKTAACPKKVAVLTELTRAETFRAYAVHSAPALPEAVAVTAADPGWVYDLRASEGSQVQQGSELLTLVVGGNEVIAALKLDVARKAKVLSDRREAKVRNERSIQAAERDLQKSVALLEKEIAPFALLLKAPVAGVVQGIQAVAGADVSAADVLMEVRTDSQLLVSLPLPAADAARFVMDETLEVRVEGLDQALAAAVIAVGDDRALLRLDNHQGTVQPGSRATVRKLKAEHADAVSVPTRAILKDSLGDFVYVFEKKKARKLYVGLGASEGDRTMIARALMPGTQVIVSGFDCLSDKKSVRVVSEGEWSREITAAKPVAGKEEAKPEAGREEFIAYLQANKEALGFEHFEKSEWKGLPAVRIVSGPETQKKLLDVIPQFAVSSMTFELEGYRIISHIAFKKVEAAAVVREEKRPLPVKRGKIGVHGSYFQMLGKFFKNAYGAAMIGFGGELSFRFTDKLDLWVSGGMAGKKVTPEWSGDEMKFSLIPLSGAVRYYLAEKGKLSPFAGAGINVYLVKDSSPTGEIDTTAIGPHVLGGFYYRLGGKLQGSLLAKFNLISKDVVPESDLDAKMDLSGLELMLGLSYSF